MSNKADLILKAARLRERILDIALKAGKGHVPPAFSCVDILTTLYYGSILRYRPDDPKWDKRDRFILSKGHGCLALYCALSDAGFFPERELFCFSGHGSMLAGHPDTRVPGVEVVSGSLGHGLGMGAGMALAARMDKKTWRAYVLLGDGECNEGALWEAAMFAGHHRLSNLVAIVDRNGLGATDFTENFLSLEPLDRKWKVFGWDVMRINGHSFKALQKALLRAKSARAKKPSVIIADTVKGKGVDFMQNSPLWHHRLPKGDEAQQAMRTLRSCVERAKVSGKKQKK
ncbi:transketolase [Elusimicrobiota bacterium]